MIDSVGHRRTGGVLVGAWAWLVAPVQFLIVHVVVEAAWPGTYGWAGNTISDLGNTTCQLWDGRPVCSPLHELMNTAFVVSGTLIVVGTLCLWPRGSVAGHLAHACLLGAGCGWALAGLAPADVEENVHLLAALAILVLGNAGLLLLAGSAPRRRARSWALPLGLVGLVGAALFATGHDLGLGPGGMERVAAYALPIWGIAVAVPILRASPRENPIPRLDNGTE